jgi:hypothetical protein
MNDLIEAPTALIKPKRQVIISRQGIVILESLKFVLFFSGITQGVRTSHGT